MNHHWWRAYDEAIDNPKLLLLSDRAHRAWFHLMCLASAGDGRLPARKVIELKLRLSPAKVTAVLKEMVDVGLIEEGSNGPEPHNWGTRQYKSDATDPTNAERQRRHRNRYRNGDRNGSSSVTPVTTKRKRNVPDTDTDTERKKEEDYAPSGAKKYAFESGIIKLTEQNLDQWQGAFRQLDLKAELVGLTQWAGSQGGNWFCAVSGALAKRNREMSVKLEKAKAGEVQFKNRSGKEGVL